MTATNAADCPHTLGIIYEEESGRGLTHPFFILILEAFRKKAEELGYDITFIHHTALQEGESWQDRLKKNSCAGVCIVCAYFEDPSIKELSVCGIPCITIDHLYRKTPAVLSDNETGVRKLVEYAIQQGHKRIAYVHGHNNSVVTRTRIIQFRNVMAFYDLPVPKEYIREGLYDDITLTRSIVQELLSLEERPTCILLPDDMGYLGAQEAAARLGLRIPEDISFEGYDGIPLTQALEPKLTTIRQSTTQMGITAAERLISLIENPQNANRMPAIFPIELLEGGTVAKIGNSE